MKIYDVIFAVASAFGIYAVVDSIRTMEALISGIVIGAYVLWRCRHDH